MDRMRRVTIGGAWGRQDLHHTLSIYATLVVRSSSGGVNRKGGLQAEFCISVPCGFQFRTFFQFPPSSSPRPPSLSPNKRTLQCPPLPPLSLSPLLVSHPPPSPAFFSCNSHTFFLSTGGTLLSFAAVLSRWFFSSFSF